MTDRRKPNLGLLVQASSAGIRQTMIRASIRLYWVGPVRRVIVVRVVFLVHGGGSMRRSRRRRLGFFELTGTRDQSCNFLSPPLFYRLRDSNKLLRLATSNSRRRIAISNASSADFRSAIASRISASTFSIEASKPWSAI